MAYVLGLAYAPRIARAYTYARPAVWSRHAPGVASPGCRSPGSAGHAETRRASAALAGVCIMHRPRPRTHSQVARAAATGRAPGAAKETTGARGAEDAVFVGLRVREIEAPGRCRALVLALSWGADFVALGRAADFGAVAPAAVGSRVDAAVQTGALSVRGGQGRWWLWRWW